MSVFMAWKISLQELAKKRVKINNLYRMPDLESNVLELRIAAISDDFRLASYYIWNKQKEEVVGRLVPNINWKLDEYLGHDYTISE